MKDGRLASTELFGNLEAVTNPGFRHDIAGRRRIRFKFLAQLANKYTQIFDLFGAVASPDCAQQCTVGNNFSRATGKVYKKIKFFGSEMYFLALKHYLMGSQINFQVTGFDNFWLIAI